MADMVQFDAYLSYLLFTGIAALSDNNNMAKNWEGDNNFIMIVFGNPIVYISSPGR